MEPKYSEWIGKWLAENGSGYKNGYGQCREASEDMALAFPELEVVKGHVYCDWGKRGHWWCRTKEGQIVDPTWQQFNVIFEHEEWKEGMEMCLGRCMNCGEEIWGVSTNDIYSTCLCSAECAKSFNASLFS